MRFILRVIKWLFVLLILMIIGLATPVAYVETMCRGDVAVGAYKPLITDKAFQRPEANTYLTYPEWHIVYAYDGLAETLKQGDEWQFDYLSSVTGFWKSTCSLMRIADQHGGADQQTRIMIHTIGVSFTLEMALKAAYEESIGRLFVLLRGQEKTPQDTQVALTSTDYAKFLRQMPWYKYDFDAANAALWDVPVTEPYRGWERRLAIGTEWKAKSWYAQAIAAGVAATGQAKLEIRSMIAGLPAADLRAIEGVKVISESPDGILIETPRYDIFTHILQQIVGKGGLIKEIAGNDEIMVSLTIPDGALYQGPGEVITRMRREGFGTERLLVSLKTFELPNAFTVMQIADPGIEHVFDY
jgi:hypothetical protein